MSAVYVGFLLFGGLLILASFFGGGHDAEAHVGDADAGGGDGHGDGHDQSQASAWLSLFGLRFWSFGAAFFGLTGLILYAATGTGAVPTLLALHLGTVLAFFLLMPYSKMIHGFYRVAALIRDAQIKQQWAAGSHTPKTTAGEAGRPAT